VLSHQEPACAVAGARQPPEGNTGTPSQQWSERDTTNNKT
jgi:hypothetical protein